MDLAVDLDGVLADITPEVGNRIKQDFGIDVPVEKYTFGEDFGLGEYEQIPDRWVFKTLFNDEWFWAKAKPYEENIRQLIRWSEQGHKIHIVTGRDKQKCGLVTLGWLRKHKVPHDKLAFEPVMHKIVYIKDNDIPVIFEDRFYEANRCASFGVRAFVIKRKWNESYVDRVTNPLLTYIDELSQADSFVNGVV